MNKVTVLHDFDGSLYFKALQDVADVEYLNIQPFRFLVRDIVKCRKAKKSSLASLFFLFSMFFKRNEKIIIGTAPFNFRLFFYVFILSRNNDVYLHTSWPYWVESPPVVYFSYFNKLVKKLWMVCLPKLSGIIAVTHAAKKSVIEFLELNQCKVPYSITQIYHVVDIPKIDEKLFSEKWSTPNSVTFLGRLEKEKGIFEVIELSKKLDIQGVLNFQVIGKGSLEKEIVRWAEGCNNFFYHGFISCREEVRRFLAKTNVLVLPSKRIPGWEELFGLVIIEAMSQGVIVLTTDHIGPKEIINNGHDSFFYEEDDFVASSAVILEDLGKDPYKYMHIAEKAILKSQTFNMVSIGRQWKEFLRANS